MLQTKIPSYFSARREALMSSHPTAIFLFPANPHPRRNLDVHYPFRQESCFYYLSGFDEPNSFLVVSPSTDKAGFKTTLFVMPKNPEREIWDGERYGLEGALEVFGVDESFSIEELDQRIPALMQKAEKVFYHPGDLRMNQRVGEWLEQSRAMWGRGGEGYLPQFDSHVPLGDLRLFKSAEEIDLMRKSCRISAIAHETLMKEVRPGMNEGGVEALVDYIFRKSGAARVAYGSIVAGGKNAACLHYSSNNDVLRDGDLLLVDAGGEFGYYASDITRTFPIGRSFSKTHASIYDLVLNTQKRAVELCRPGATLIEIHKEVCEILVDGCLSLGLFPGSNREAILKAKKYVRFYPHQTSHWLGMDVHDLGRYNHEGGPRKLAPGMVLTIEPGFYVQPGDDFLPPFGIRIEDDILITAEGNENLTALAPKERSDIEKLRHY